ncbi:MAG: Gfo/Idh/MocA family oxidoreductase, partial [Nocardioidaceae bacterium]|nr:Gfo/Idh/MocA family oxidoreductase [Nocardioidaceae bacterium]
GILATGNIAHKFADDLRLVPDATIAAVAARRQGSADAFAAEYADDGRTPTAYGSYEALAADPDVDVVYVASPHSLHHEQVTMLLEAGKPVLCEKAITLNAAQTQDLVDLAAAKGLFLMEAMWMACHPLIVHVRERMAAGDFGTPHQLFANLGFRVEAAPTDRLLSPELGGGVLLDMGVYPLTLAQLFLGEPEQVRTVGTLADSGVDLDVAVAQHYPGGAVASLFCSMTSHLSRTATIGTDAGRLDFPPGFHHPRAVTWTPFDGRRAGTPETIEPPSPVIGSGLGNEAVEVMRCLREGLTESPLVPHAQTLALMHQLDAIRAEIGVVYPGEERR